MDSLPSYSGKLCSIEMCWKPHYAKGFCEAHYARMRRNGSPHKIINDQHGMSRSRIYYVWKSIKARCNNKRSDKYPLYGGRGIKICERWNENFMEFYADMGDPPAGMQIDRIDNDGNYCPENCRWTTPAQNSRNSRATKLTPSQVISIRNDNMPYREIAKKYGITKGHVRDIKAMKWWREL